MVKLFGFSDENLQAAMVLWEIEQLEVFQAMQHHEELRDVAVQEKDAVAMMNAHEAFEQLRRRADELSNFLGVVEGVRADKESALRHCNFHVKIGRN